MMLTINSMDIILLAANKNCVKLHWNDAPLWICLF